MPVNSSHRRLFHDPERSWPATALTRAGRWLVCKCVWRRRSPATTMLPANAGVMHTLRGCPWHPQGGCGFSRHGTCPRARPPGALIARWYCPLARRTVSALPHCLWMKAVRCRPKTSCNRTGTRQGQSSRGFLRMLLLVAGCRSPASCPSIHSTRHCQ